MTEPDPMTEVTWARNPWDPNHVHGKGSYVLEVFEYDIEDWTRVAASYNLDAIKAIADSYNLSDILIARFGNVFTPGEHRITHYGIPLAEH